MREYLRMQLEARGYCLIECLCPEKPTGEVATEIGAVLRIPGVTEVQTLTPKRQEEATPNTYSGLYGTGQFPLHTDFAHARNPPRYLLLRCIIGEPDVETLLLDSLTLLQSVEPDLLSRSLVRPRRPYLGKLPLLRLLTPIENRCFRFRWDTRFLEPASSIGQLGMLRVQEALSLLAPLGISLSKRGDTLIIDNWRMLHGRSGVPDGSTSRKVERAYLETVH